VKGIAAFSNTVAVMLLPAALLSEMYSENTSASQHASGLKPSLSASQPRPLRTSKLKC
jgi:hypothetical protein